MAITPTSRGGLGFSVLEDKRLLDWGTVAKTEPLRMKKRIERLLTRYSPCVIVVPLGRNKFGVGKRRVIEMIRSVANEQEADLWSYESRPSAKTKHILAVELTEHFFELKPWLPRRRKPWNSESETMAIFDSLRMTVAEKLSDNRNTDLRTFKANEDLSSGRLGRGGSI